MAANGWEALEALRRQRYDLVLMDVQMPEMDGLEATRRIRAELPPAGQPHIIAMTASALRGMDDFLGKPVLTESLRQALLRAPHAECEPPAIDPSLLESLRKLGEIAGRPLVQETLDRFLTEAPKRLARIRDALGRGDAPALLFEAHSLKGSSAQIGAVRVAAVCGELEQRGRSADLTAAAGFLDDLERELARVKPLLEEWIVTSRPQLA